MFHATRVNIGSNRAFQKMKWQTRERHFHILYVVCFIALTMMRLIQRKVAMAEPKPDADGDLKWSYGMSGERLSAALREWQALRHNNGVLQMLNSSGEDLRRILAALGVNLKPTMYTEGTLNTLKSTVKAF